jgi:transposase-like protein
MKCPKCKSDNISKRGKRYNKSGEKQLYLCNKCNRKFVEQDGFERMRNEPKIIARAIHMHNDGLSLFQVQNHLWQYDGIKVSREAIRLWEKKYGIFLK